MLNPWPNQNRPFSIYSNFNLALSLGGIEQRKSHLGWGMCNQFLLFYSPRPWAIVRVLIYVHSCFWLSQWANRLFSFSQYRLCDDSQENWSFVSFIKKSTLRHIHSCMYSFQWTRQRIKSPEDHDMICTRKTKWTNEKGLFCVTFITLS